jgi:transposase-like protein
MLYDVACPECGADVLSAAGFRAGGRWVIRFACRSCSASWEVESEERMTVVPTTPRDAAQEQSTSTPVSLDVEAPGNSSGSGG